MSLHFVMQFFFSLVLISEWVIHILLSPITALFRYKSFCLQISHADLLAFAATHLAIYIAHIFLNRNKCTILMTPVPEEFLLAIEKPQSIVVTRERV